MPTEDQNLQIGTYLQIYLYKRMQQNAYSFKWKGY